MKVLFLSKEGDGLGVGHRMVMQDNDVSFYIKEPRFEMAGKGIVKRVPSWREAAIKADLIICDMVGFGYLEDTLKLLGKPTISCNRILEQAELDRKKGMQACRAMGVDIPESWACKNGKEALEITRTIPWDKGFVIKPDDNIATAKTMVITEQEEWSWALDQIPGSLIIQRIVEGVEISTEGWFNGRDFIKPFLHTFEEKKFLNDDLGPATGCMGNVVFAVESNRLTKATVEKFKPFLSAVGYRGPLDLNCIVNESGAYCLEITARMGYDAVEAMLEGLREPIIDLFFECAQGIKKRMEIERRALIAVRLSVPPWPHAKPKGENRGEPVLGLSEGVLKHAAITDLYRDGSNYLTAGGDGVLLKCTASGGVGSNGSLVREAQRRVYTSLKAIRVSGKQYRTDIGDRVDGDWKKLQSWGWVV